MCSIEVPLAPCELPATYEVDERRLEGRRISFDFTQVPVTTLRELAGKSLRFPKNPEHGYVDGSLYVEHAHNPVDLTEISFGSVSRDRVEAILRADFISEFERVQEPRGAAADAPHVR